MQEAWARVKSPQVPVRWLMTHYLGFLYAREYFQSQGISRNDALA